MSAGHSTLLSRAVVGSLLCSAGMVTSLSPALMHVTMSQCGRTHSLSSSCWQPKLDLEQHI